MCKIHDIWPSVGAALGAPGFDNVLDLPEARGYVVFLVDGLGEINLREHVVEAPFLNGLEHRRDVRSNLPSTTVTSLTSLGTGLRPGRHGVAGYTVRVPQTGQRLNQISWDQPIDAVAWQPHAMVLERLDAAGEITAATVNEARFAGSGLTQCSQRGVAYHAVTSTWQRHEVLLDLAEAPGQSAVYAYESGLDHTGHQNGCTSQKWRDQLNRIDSDLERLRVDLPSDVRLIVTADHGMLDLPATDRFDIDEHPWLLDGVELIAGEARFRHVHVRPGIDHDEVAERWRSLLGDRAIVRLRDECADWFGPLDPSVAGRFGDVIVAALGDFALFSSREFPMEMKMSGFHGSTSEVETRIPLLIA